MSLVESQLAALREIEQQWPESQAVIIGATALGFFFDMSWRHTADVDLVVALTVDALSALAQRPGWSQDHQREHEFISPRGAKIDVIPAGSSELQTGWLHWSNGHRMSLVGIDLAFEHAVRRQHGVLVAPPPVVVILKMVAFGDRPTERERDLVDIAYLLDEYVTEADERRWNEVPEGIDFELAPAYLLGLDVARILSKDDHRLVVGRFLCEIESSDSWAHLSMQRRGPARWRTQSNALGRRLTAFRAGMQLASET